MNKNLPSKVQIILDKFQNAGFQIYIVGGAVRDLLMGRQVSDWDFTTDAKPEEILKLFPEGFYDNKFGTVGIDPLTFARGDAEEGSRRLTRNEVRMDGGKLERQDPEQKTNILEITTMRKEGVYLDHRHPTEVSWTNNIEKDLARRDFTINAMALDHRFTLINPFFGEQDIKEKLIRAVGNPNKRFQEDALRLVRAIRIAAELEFKIEEKTYTAIKENSHLLNQISFERISQEFFKILQSTNPYIGILKLREVGILQIILPELEKCFGVVQEGPKHDRVYDVGEHSLQSLKHCPSNDPLIRFATLIHDIGKPKTHSVSETDGNVTFYGHDVVGAKIARKIAERFRLSNKQTDKLVGLVRWHLFPVDERQTDSAIRRFIKNVGLENIDDMMDLRVADRLGGGTQKAVSWRMEKFKERIHQVLQKPFSVTDLKVDGRDVMETLNIPPGPKVGEILNKLFKEVLEDSTKNNREYLLKRITDFLKSN